MYVETKKHFIDRHPTIATIILFALLGVAIVASFLLMALVCYAICSLIGISFSWLYAAIVFVLFICYIAKIG